MSDLISRSALLKKMDEFYDKLVEKCQNTPNHAEAFCMIDTLIVEQSTVESIPKEKLQEICERLEDEKVLLFNDYTEEYEYIVFLDEAIEIIKEVGEING